MYSTINFKTKKVLTEAVKSGQTVGVFQYNDMFGKTEAVQTGEHRVTLEGPHYPESHRWYAQAVVRDGQIVSIK